ncbi:MAG: hypothetical protein GY841_23230, partial [FCB group bacterium]|nr:hypothetical protein [FCB group bacterium]
MNASGAALEFGEAALEVPAGALSAAAAVVVTPLDEQGLPALLPYGWSPRGAVWLETESDFSTAATLSIPAQSASGTLLTAAELDLGTLQWYSLGTFAVSEGRITVPVTTSGAYAAVEGDSGPLAPPAAIDGEVLGSSPQPLTAWATTAELSFDPKMVLATQRSRVTAEYTLDTEAASGLPLTLLIREELTLLDGTERWSAPFRADLVLYHAPDGTPRSRFWLQPSRAAQSLPIATGGEDVVVLHYGEEIVRGNVLGPDGGSVQGDEGVRLDVPAGALDQPTAIVLTRQDVDDLPLASPSGGSVAGVVELDL